jgi:LmbE family N-acetylglucosaminyl deacetylase
VKELKNWLMEFKDKKILIVVAHPDDEILGLGATMHKLIRETNCETRVVILGEGITSRSDNRDTEMRACSTFALTPVGRIRTPEAMENFAQLHFAPGRPC